MALAKRRAQRMVAADILNANGAEFIGFYGRWAWEGYSPARPTEGAARSSDDEAHDVARRPEQIPSLFVEAWNRRDPDQIASLSTTTRVREVKGLCGMTRVLRRRTPAVWRHFQRVEVTADEGGSNSCRPPSQLFTRD